MNIFKKKNSRFYLCIGSIGLGLFSLSVVYGFGDTKHLNTDSPNEDIEQKSFLENFGSFGKDTESNDAQSKTLTEKILEDQKIQKKNLELISSPEYQRFQKYLDQVMLGKKTWPTEFKVLNEKFKIQYTLNASLNQFVKNELKKFKTEHAAVVVMDNETGKILAAAGFSGQKGVEDQSLVLSNSHPAASLIKIVTAAELVSKGQVNKESEFSFSGRSTTLFKYQLNPGRGGRVQTFETAFAKSNNVVFGKAAIMHMSAKELVSFANNFGFNQPLMNELSVASHMIPTEDQYELAELASGFNTMTLISPIHGAQLSQIIANDGDLIKPQLVEEITDQQGKVVWKNITDKRKVLESKANEEMRLLMQATIEDGTARKSFRKMPKKLYQSLEIGGKTGSITGGVPFGKRDWFTAYAKPKNLGHGKGISISVMNVNLKRWYVKSSFLAKTIIEHYYRNINPIPLTLAAPDEFTPVKVGSRNNRLVNENRNYRKQIKKRSVKIAKQKFKNRKSLFKKREIASLKVKRNRN